MSVHRRLPVAGVTALSAVAAAVCSSLAHAAATPAEEELAEIIVAGSLDETTPLELSRYGNDLEIVTAEQVRNHGFVDLTQAVEMLVPGAFVATQAGPFSYSTVALQGSRTSDVLWTVDGVRINNRLYNSTSPADTLPSSMIERIEVLKGGQGVLYGTQASAGVINVVTRGFSGQPGGGVSLGTDTRNGVHVDGHLRGAMGVHQLTGWASLDKSDGYELYDAYTATSTSRKREYDVKNFGLRYGVDLGEDLRLTLQGVHTEAALDYPSPSSTNVNERDVEVLSGRLDYSPREGFDVFVKGYFHDWDTDYYPATDPAASAYWGFRDYGVGAATRFDLGRGLEYHLGYDFQNYRGTDEVLRIDGLTEKTHAVYGQIRTTDDLSTRAHFAAGVRYNDAGGATATVWSASGVFRFTDRLYVESTLGTSFLLPDAYQLYGIEPDDTRGNPDLEPEESFNINVAVGGTVPAFRRELGWQLTGWRRRVTNLITSDDSAPPPGFSGVFVNIDDTVKVSGGEALLRGALTGALQFDLSYLYSRELGPNGRQLQNRPRQSAKLGLSFAPQGQPWGADIALKYVGTMYTNVGGLPQQTYGKDVIANLGAHWLPDGQGGHHRVGLRVENLLDTDYATRIRSFNQGGSPVMYRNLGVPRTLHVKYSYSF